MLPKVGTGYDMGDWHGWKQGTDDEALLSLGMACAEPTRGTARSDVICRTVVAVPPMLGSVFEVAWARVDVLEAQEAQKERIKVSIYKWLMSTMVAGLQMPPREERRGE